MEGDFIQEIGNARHVLHILLGCRAPLSAEGIQDFHAAAVSSEVNVISIQLQVLLWITRC